MSPLRPWIEFVALLGIGVAAVVATVIVPNRAKTERLRQQRDVVARDVEAAQLEIDRLAREIEALQSDSWFIERRLRTDLRFLRPGELLFQEDGALPSPSRPAAPPTGKVEKP